MIHEYLESDELKQLEVMAREHVARHSTPIRIEVTIPIDRSKNTDLRGSVIIRASRTGPDIWTVMTTYHGCVLYNTEWLKATKELNRQCVLP